MGEQFEKITKDIGQELKDTARRIYTRTFVVWLIVAILEVVATIILVASSDGDLLGVFLALPFVVVIEYWIMMGIVHMISINLYAKGEIVHLLKKNGGSDFAGGANKPPVKPKAPSHNLKQSDQVKPKVEEIVEHTHLDDTWTCAYCGTDNSQKYSQCKKCGTYRTGVREEDNEERSDATAASVKVTPAAHIDDTWMCYKCGTKNSMKYGQCKKCGQFKQQ